MERFPRRRQIAVRCGVRFWDGASRKLDNWRHCTSQVCICSFNRCAKAIENHPLSWARSFAIVDLPVLSGIARRANPPPKAFSAQVQWNGQAGQLQGAISCSCVPGLPTSRAHRCAGPGVRRPARCFGRPGASGFLFPGVCVRNAVCSRVRTMSVLPTSSLAQNAVKIPAENALGRLIGSGRSGPVTLQ